MPVTQPLHKSRLVRAAGALLVVVTLSACASLLWPQAPQRTVQAPTPPAAPSAAPEAEPPAGPAPLRILAVGDIMLDASARPVMQEQGYHYAFRQFRSMFEAADVVFGNLEGPLTARGAADGDKTYLFRSPPFAASMALVLANFRVVSLANNHMLDYGAEGLADTMAALDVAGVAHAGAGRNLNEARKPAIVEASGRRIAFLAYSMTLPETFYATDARAGTAFGHEEQVRADVAAARAGADVVLVSFHWGQEGSTRLREYQVRLGRAAIDAGAAAVIGHHPHIVQSVERYRDGVILYSLGNFAFGSYSPRSTVGAVAELIVVGERVTTLRMHPVNVNNFEVQFQPQRLQGEAARQAVDTLVLLARARGTELSSDGGTAVLDLTTPAAESIPLP